MSRPGISPAEDAVLMRISDILMSDACQSIDFQYAGFHLNWVNYTAIALSAVSPDPKPDRLRVIVGAFQGNQDSSYDPRTNTIKLKAWSYGSSTLSEKSTIVHECTHAAIDQQSSPKTISRLDNEILAFVAQLLFIRLSGSSLAAGSSPTSFAAQDIANKIKDQSVASLSADDVATLAQAIKDEPGYAFLKNRVVTDTNDGVPF